MTEKKAETQPGQMCTHCIMDTTDPEIWFDEEGVCSHCLAYQQQGSPIVEAARSSEEPLNRMIAEIKKRGFGKEYDCVLGLSGGVDSTYLAYLAKKYSLRVLAVHCDSGWNSELAVKNIENIIKKLNFDLYTYVIDWEEIRDLQLAFFKASLANCDIPQDHAFLAVLYRIANKHGIKYILSGGNAATEFILPKAWGYNASDLRHLKSVHRAFGTRKLVNYPTLNFWKRYFYYPYVKRIKSLRLLDCIDYNKEEVKKTITKELEWRDYGGKHFESIFTRFFQGYYLPTKFNFDKRKAHLSSLIVSGQLTRQEALNVMEEVQYSEHQIKEDKEFVSKKLGLSLEEFDKILALEKKTYRDYASNARLFRGKDALVLKLKKIHHV